MQTGVKRKRQAHLLVCLLFLTVYISGILQACGRKQPELFVCFFACSEDADSILLKTEDAAVLIDTGDAADEEALLEKLHAADVTSLNLLILTHPDKDHIGGACAVLSEFPVEQVIATSCEKGSRLQEELDGVLLEKTVSVPRDTQTFSYGELTLTIYPPKEASYKNANNYSIAVLAQYEGKSFFFAGDAKKKRIRELLDEKLPQADVYKVAYHGRDLKEGKELIERLKPSYAVVTAKQAEEGTEKALLEAGSEILSTYGEDVVFTVKEGILDVE